MIALRVLRAAVGLGTAGLMAHAVDTGFTAAWSTLPQGAWFVAMIVVGSFGLGPVLRFVGQHERLAWLPLLGMLLLAAVYPLAWQFKLRLGIPYLSSYLAAFALTFAYGAWRRSWWLWQDPNQWLSEAVGDRIAQVVYMTLALVLVVAAVMHATR